IDMTTSCKGIMKFIIAENYSFIILTWIVWLFLLISLIENDISVISWYIFIFKFIICDLVGFVFTFIFGGIAWDWKFD
ncbi:MAG: hypothetical protein K2J47_02870, partial [Ruminococcus sp.]|nr:hypothetical protein [Ruminococcus sp.]